MVADPQVDAVVIGTWPYTHCTMVVAALQQQRGDVAQVVGYAVPIEVLLRGQLRVGAAVDTTAGRSVEDPRWHEYEYASSFALSYLFVSV